MALINCPECGKQVSDTAKKCVGCGYKLKRVKKNGLQRNKKKIIIASSIIVGLVIIAAIVLFIGTSVNWSGNAWNKIMKSGSFGCLKEHSWGE